jgi:hypothetical protein
MSWPWLFILQPFSRSFHRQPILERLCSERLFWSRAQRLTENDAAQQFQIHRGHPFKIVKLIAEYLVLPVMVSDVSADVVGPLLHGALMHSRASLRSFASATHTVSLNILRSALSWNLLRLWIREGRTVTHFRSEFCC